MDPDEGEVFLGAHSLKEQSLDGVRRHIAVVEQDTFLWNATIEENIRYARPEASSREVVDAARRAAVHEFIMSLPQGYLTPVGERGLQLSTGQRQRIAVARALIQAAPTLVLDEATAALDEEAESALLQRTLDCFQHATVVILSHRFAPVRRASEVFVLENGRIVENGDPSRLLSAGGRFTRLFEEGRRLAEASTRRAAD